MKLDGYDLAILRALQDNGRLSVVDLARAINLSATPCAARLKKLESAGVITGYQAQLDPDLLGAGLMVFIQVHLTSTTHEALSAFNEAVQDVPEILECHMVGGGCDYLLKIRVADMMAFRELLSRRIATLPGIQNTSSYFVMEDVKNRPFQVDA